MSPSSRTERCAFSRCPSNRGKLTWTTPDGTRTYPVEWRLRVPSEGLDLQITPYFPNQELDVPVRYWEGTVQVQGSASGRGYLEMTGHGESSAAPGF